MRAIVSIVGNDRVGIIAESCTLIASMNINILDIHQTVMEGFFTMTMLVDTAKSDWAFEDIRKSLYEMGENTGLSIRIQREDTFNAMYNI